MRPFLISIYWKIFFTIMASIFLTSVAMGFIYLGFAPQLVIHPQLKKTVLLETRALAAEITSRLQTSSQPLPDILRHIHQTEHANLVVFDRNGQKIASCLEDGLRDRQKISARILQTVLASGSDIELLYPSMIMVPVISVPLHLRDGNAGILQCYYPATKGLKRILPRGLPELISILILCSLTGLLSRYLTLPVRELTRAARTMAKGNFGAQVKIRSHDEVGTLARTFNNMSQRLAEMNTSRRELFSDISHELRSPLARIFTDAEILIDSSMPVPERKQHLKAICSEVKNLDNLIGDLAILARTEQDRVDILFTTASLQDVLSQAVSLFILQIEEKGIALHQNIEQDLSTVMIDPKRIGQVISNLLMNAIHYTPTDGTIEIGLHKKDAWAEVWVKDTGAGIPANKLPFIFERFFRVDKSRSRATGGSGLGLAIARQFIEAHGGEIRAQSRIGQGTCITFTLPMQT